MMTWIVAIFWTVGLSVSPFVGRTKIANKTWYKFTISLLIIVSGIGFWGNSLSAAGELDWLPISFEWPVGFAEGVVSTDGGYYIVPITHSNRVQIYDADWTFVRGWYVNAYGGKFWINHSDGDTFKLMTARGNMLYEYNLEGELLGLNTYLPESRPLITNHGEDIYVSTPFWAFIWSNPFYSLFFGLIAIIMIKTGQKPDPLLNKACSKEDSSGLV